jgi:hypothetical protein
VSLSDSNARTLLMLTEKYGNSDPCSTPLARGGTLVPLPPSKKEGRLNQKRFKARKEAILEDRFEEREKVMLKTKNNKTTMSDGNRVIDVHTGDQACTRSGSDVDNREVKTSHRNWWNGSGGTEESYLTIANRNLWTKDQSKLCYEQHTLRQP